MPIRPLKFSLWCSSCTASIGQRSTHKICIFSHILHSLTSSHTFDTYSLSLHINHIYITTVSNHLSSRTQQTDAAATNKSISPLQFEISAPPFGGVWSKWRSSIHTANLSPQQAFCWFSSPKFGSHMFLQFQVRGSVLPEQQALRAIVSNLIYVVIAW